MDEGPSINPTKQTRINLNPLLTNKGGVKPSDIATFRQKPSQMTPVPGKQFFPISVRAQRESPSKTVKHKLYASDLSDDSEEEDNNSDMQVFFVNAKARKQKSNDDALGKRDMSSKEILRNLHNSRQFF